MNTVVGAFRLKEQAIKPTYGSDDAACFDLYSCMVENDSITYYNEKNQKGTAYVKDGKVTIFSGQRFLIPTGFIFDIPARHSMRIHPRSGLALKNGIVVANCEGVVDCDYVEQTYVMVANVSHEPFEVSHGMRIAQAEVVADLKVHFVHVPRKPGAKTDRKGGFGSTGV